MSDNSPANHRGASFDRVFEIPFLARPAPFRASGHSSQLAAKTDARPLIPLTRKTGVVYC